MNTEPFKLTQTFISKYEKKNPSFGTLGEFIFKRTYARKTNNKLEEFWQTTKRVVEGTYSIQKDHCARLNLPWNDRKAQFSAQAMFDKIWNFKFLPPGRGLWMMGTEFIEKKGGAALNNCGFVSTEEINSDFSAPFCWVMDMSMLGVGCGFDTAGRKLNMFLKSPRTTKDIHTIPDTREGWVEALRRVLDSFTNKDTLPEDWDFSQIRSVGEEIKGFGGISSGYKPLETLLKNITSYLVEYTKNDAPVDSTLIVDMMNEIGACVVSGNVRRSAEIGFSDISDLEFLELKNPNNSEFLTKPRWASNNSVIANVGDDYSNISKHIATNGEPGVLWLENARKYGRIDNLTDCSSYKDSRAKGTNPCGEQTLEPFELCCLVETFPINHESLEDYKETLKYAYLYAKTVTLVKTHDARTNAVMMRNRRIGTSQSGIVQNIQKVGLRTHFDWCEKGYTHLLDLDKEYSNWLCVPRSIKITSVKPSGTVSLLPGVTPGIHYPHSRFYIRRVRLSKTDPSVSILKKAGYLIEDDKAQPNYSCVVEFLVEEKFFAKSKKDVSMWEQLELAAQMQSYWADNQVSVTVTFNSKEKDFLASALSLYETRLKSVSFLPLSEHGYSQAPYEEITKEEYLSRTKALKKVKYEYDSPKSFEFCEGDSCSLNSSFENTLDKRFLEKINITPSCWNWIGSKTKQGYGMFWWEGKNVFAHRFSYEHYNDIKVEKEEIIRHICNNSSCVNPAHLEKGTQKDNVSDSFRQGRRKAKKGSLHKNSKLTEEQVRNIKTKYSAGVAQYKLAKEYSVSRSTIRNIVTGVSWSHV